MVNLYRGTVVAILHYAGNGLACRINRVTADKCTSRSMHLIPDMRDHGEGERLRIKP